MGTFRFSDDGVDLTDLAFPGIGRLPFSSRSANGFVLLDDVFDARLTATGSGLTYRSGAGTVGAVATGVLSTLTGVEGVDWSIEDFEWTALNLSAARVAGYLAAADWAALRSYLFSGADRIVGTAGEDALTGGADADTMLGRGGDDIVAGDAGQDLLYGSVGNDEVYGGTGADVLYGGAGIDELDGGTGADTLYGGGDGDGLTGGAGRDVFVFNTRIGATQRDSIDGFSALDDVIHLDNAVFRAFATTGTMQAARFHQGTTAQDAGDRILYFREEGELRYDPDGTGAAAAVLFAVVLPGTALGYQDIVII